MNSTVLNITKNEKTELIIENDGVFTIMEVSLDKLV
jgi:hypothetical protein